MKKKVIISLSMLMLTTISNAQDFYHGLGGQINYGIFTTKVNGERVETDGAAVPGLFYKATLAFEINRNLNFAISSYPFIGVSGTLNSQSGASDGASFGAELPILGELYFGDPDDNCFILGAGFTAAFLGTSGYGSGAIVGPQLEMAGQFSIRNQLIGIRFAYAYGMNGKGNNTELIKYSRSMLDFGFYYPLGQ